jgi:hypothetical protein
VQRGWARSGMALARRPALWGTALRQAVRLARPGWWHRRPFLPVPDAGYLRFRMITAYGDPDRVPAPNDVITYLRWCRDQP